MLRLSGAVVLGYVAMALAVFAGLTAAYLLMGADGAFRPDSYDVSLLWVVTSVVVSFAAALLGGWLARRIGRNTTAPRALAALVAVLGLGMAVAAAFNAPDDPGVRTGVVDTFAAMQQARTPLWMMLLNPVIGALGVLWGGRALGTHSAPADDSAMTRT